MYVLKVFTVRVQQKLFKGKMDLVRPISGPLESTANIESHSELDMSKYSGTSVHFFPAYRIKNRTISDMLTEQKLSI